MSSQASPLDERIAIQGGPSQGEEVVGETPWRLFWRQFREDKVALVALGFIVFEVLVAVFAPLIVRLVAHPPNAEYPSALNPVYGTDGSCTTGTRPPTTRPPC